MGICLTVSGNGFTLLNVSVASLALLSRHVVNRDMGICLTVSGNGFTLLNVSVASLALLRFNGLKAILMAHRAVKLMLHRRRHLDVSSVHTGGKKSRHGNDNEFLRAYRTSS